MNNFFIYTIWQRVPDEVVNPEFARLQADLGDIADKDSEEYKAIVAELGDIEEIILDPKNSSGVRYVAVKCVHDIAIAQEVCKGGDGEFMYTFQEAWFGEAGQ